MEQIKIGTSKALVKLCQGMPVVAGNPQAPQTCLEFFGPGQAVRHVCIWPGVLYMLQDHAGETQKYSSIAKNCADCFVVPPSKYQSKNAHIDRPLNRVDEGSEAWTNQRKKNIRGVSDHVLLASSATCHGPASDYVHAYDECGIVLDTDGYCNTVV